MASGCDELGVLELRQAGEFAAKCADRGSRHNKVRRFAAVELRKREDFVAPGALDGADKLSVSGVGVLGHAFTAGKLSQPKSESRDCFLSAMS